MGSCGDLFPFVGLCRALVAREHEVLTRDLRDAMAGADLVVTHPAHVAAHNVAEHLHRARPA
jgi:hypothetical protein